MIQGQGGSTLIELLVAMPIALLLIGVILQALGAAGRNQQDIENRTETLTKGQIQLERMTHEIRAADWVYFRSSSVVDIQARVRSTPTSSAVKRIVRYDCSGEVCVRSEGTPTLFPPPNSPTFTASSAFLGEPSSDKGSRAGQIIGHDIFRPTKVDAATGASTVNYAEPDFLFVRLRLAVKGREDPVVLEDGVSLRNRSTFAS